MKLFILLFASFAFSLQLSAACVSNKHEFEENKNGTVIDKKSQLMWMKCSLGATWENNTCAGSALKYDWKNAVYSVSIFNDYTAPGGYSDWRLPTIKELETIVASNCVNPAIDEKAFPATRSSGYWSITEDASYDYGAYLVFFLHGKPYLSNKQAEWFVRLVRNL